MPLYDFSERSFNEVPLTSFAKLSIKERDDVQEALTKRIEVISPDTYVLTAEFGNWEDSRRRIDILGLDKDLGLVVIELKRTEDGGHLELQALRYAAMVSTMTFEQAVDTNQRYLASLGLEPASAEECIRKFLEVDDGPVALSNRVRIVLASAEFSKEVTSTVLWLNAQGLDITCFKLKPYHIENKTLIDVQQVIPLPEAAEFQVAIRQKSQATEAAQSSGRDFTRYRVITANGETFDGLTKRALVFRLVKEAVRLGISPDSIADTVAWRRSTMFICADGKLSADELLETAAVKDPKRYFCNEHDLIHFDGRTYAMSNQWGGPPAAEAAMRICNLMPQKNRATYQALG